MHGRSKPSTDRCTREELLMMATYGKSPFMLFSRQRDRRYKICRRYVLADVEVEVGAGVKEDTEPNKPTNLYRIDRNGNGGFRSHHVFLSTTETSIRLPALTFFYWQHNNFPHLSSVFVRLLSYHLTNYPIRSTIWCEASTAQYKQHNNKKLINSK